MPAVFPSFGTQFTYKWAVQKTPRFKTIHQTPASGRAELFIPLMQWNLWDYVYNISYIVGDAQVTGTTTGYQTFVGFLQSVQGQGQDFLFTDPYDNMVPTTHPQQIGVGDGVGNTFPIYRQLSASAGADLIQNFVVPPSIYLNGVLQSDSTYGIDQYGDLEFTTPPGAGVLVSWSGSFYFRCHFDDDSWTDLQENMYQLWTLEKLKFHSILL